MKNKCLLLRSEIGLVIAQTFFSCVFATPRLCVNFFSVALLGLARLPNMYSFVIRVSSIG